MTCFSFSVLGIYISREVLWGWEYLSLVYCMGILYISYISRLVFGVWGFRERGLVYRGWAEVVGTTGGERGIVFWVGVFRSSLV